MKRRSSSFQQRSLHKCNTTLFFALLLCLCIASLLLLEFNSRTINLLLPILPNPFASNPQIAFLFIARNRLPLDFYWDAFFRADKDRKFTIYVHSRPGFLLNKATTKSLYFLDRQVNDSIQVDWGEASMILAERVLLKNALLDPLNERFVFLSDSFADKKDGRYNPKMHPIIPVSNWRKGSQWVVLNRKHAEVVVKDETVFPAMAAPTAVLGRQVGNSRRDEMLVILTSGGRIFYKIKLLYFNAFYGLDSVMIQFRCKYCQHRPLGSALYFLFYCGLFVGSSASRGGSYSSYFVNLQRKSLPEFWRDQPFPVDPSKEHNCIPDEHYVQSLLANDAEFMSWCTGMGGLQH
ncbi:hypothetical protein KSS87_011190 [Heliosperma pusillum]|nr:hypothetical protein KSS87_011190 [Heliosperma pusillum]